MANDQSPSRKRCEVCGADITGLMSLERIPVQRVTCYFPDECADRLMIVRAAWRSLALLALDKRRDKVKINAAIKRLAKMGEE